MSRHMTGISSKLCLHNHLSASPLFNQTRKYFILKRSVKLALHCC